VVNHDPDYPHRGGVGRKITNTSSRSPLSASTATRILRNLKEHGYSSWKSCGGYTILILGNLRGAVRHSRMESVGSLFPMGNTRSRIRAVGILTLAGTPSYYWCFWHHCCMDGHLAHGPYSPNDWINDFWWMICFTLVAVLSWRMKAKARKLFWVGGLFLLFSRIWLQSGGGMCMPIEWSWLFTMDVCSILYLVLPKRFERHGERDAPSDNQPPSQSPTSS
jgi:hypothetical protein